MLITKLRSLLRKKWIRKLSQLILFVTVNCHSNVVKYYTLPYIGHIWGNIKSKLNKFCKSYFKNLNIKVVLIPLKVGHVFNVKNPTSMSLKSFVLYFVHAVMLFILVRNFKTIDCASTPFRLQLKEAMHIIWKKPSKATKTFKYLYDCLAAFYIYL